MGTLLVGGLVIDGTGAPGAVRDVVVTADGLIGDEAAPAPSQRVDCSGLVVCPGFVDAHSHADLEVLSHRTEKLRQGVTSEVVGNCGFSLYPSIPAAAAKVPTFDFILPGRGRQWCDCADYFASVVEKGTRNNVASLLGHSTLRLHVAGISSAPLTEEQMCRAEAILDQSMAQGCIGLSTGLNEIPSSFGDVTELVRLCRTVKKHGGFYTSHLRDYKSKVVEAVGEALEIGRRSGCKVQLSHLQCVGSKNWHRQDEVLKMIDDAIAEGIDVGIDAYPYVAGSCNLTQLLPTWAQDGGSAELLKRLDDAEVSARIAVETTELMGNTFADIVIANTAPSHLQYVGATVQEFADEKGIGGVEGALRLLRETGAFLVIISFNQSQANLKKVLTHPRTSIISDSLIVPGKPHPRCFGTYPTWLGEYVRDKKWMSLEAGVHKASGHPAARFGLKRRGVLAPGNFADVVVFDAERIGTESSYAVPDVAPTGIVHVLVNGKWALRDGALVEACIAGRPLRLDSCAPCVP